MQALWLHCQPRENGAKLGSPELWRTGFPSCKMPEEPARRGRRMYWWLMRVLAHLFALNANVLAVLVTLGIAVLLVCCIECTKCPCRDKDDIFKRHEV